MTGRRVTNQQVNSALHCVISRAVIPSVTRFDGFDHPYPQRGPCTRLWKAWYRLLIRTFRTSSFGIYAALDSRRHARKQPLSCLRRRYLKPTSELSPTLTQLIGSAPSP
eukprot:172690-Amorphochlora_amoeboformis.AAC.3